MRTIVEFESLITDIKWRIIHLLSNEKLSPLQLSQATNTSMANVSQQLKLLELADIVKKEKVSNRDKGKPRLIYSINKEIIFFASIMNHFSRKVTFQPGEYHKTILGIWSIPEQGLHKPINQLIWKINGDAKNIDTLLYLGDKKNFTLYIATDKAKEISKITGKSIPFMSMAGDQEELAIQITTLPALKKLISSRKKEISEKGVLILDKSGEITEI